MKEDFYRRNAFFVHVPATPPSSLPCCLQNRVGLGDNLLHCFCRSRRGFWQFKVLHMSSISSHCQVDSRRDVGQHGDALKITGKIQLLTALRQTHFINPSSRTTFSLSAHLSEMQRLNRCSGYWGSASEPDVSSSILSCEQPLIAWMFGRRLMRVLSARLFHERLNSVPVHYPSACTYTYIYEPNSNLK